MRQQASHFSEAPRISLGCSAARVALAVIIQALLVPTQLFKMGEKKGCLYQRMVTACVLIIQPQDAHRIIGWMGWC